MVQLLYNKVCHYLSKQNSLCYCLPRESIPDKGQGCSSGLKQGHAALQPEMTETWGHAGTRRATRRCVFNSLFFSSWRIKPCALLSSWTDRGQRTGLWPFGTDKRQSLWGKEVEIKLPVVSGQGTKMTKVATLFSAQTRGRRKSPV